VGESGKSAKSRSDPQQGGLTSHGWLFEIAAMLLTGTHPRTLDDKKRLVLPRRVRDQLGEINKLFVGQGQDQCVGLYSPNAMEQLAAKIDEAPATNAEVRTFRRLFFANMEAVDVDRAGRILVPERLLEFAGLKHEVVLIGVRDHLELWDAGRWREYEAQNAARFDAVAEEALRK
jgi:MraZ protein